MGAVSGDVNTMRMACETAADLSSRPIAGLTTGDRAFVAEFFDDPVGPFFFLVKSLSAPTNNSGIIAALGGVGSWLSERLYGAPSAPISTDNVTRLMEYPTDALRSGAVAWVGTFRALFRLDKTSVLVPDGAIVVAAADGGNWLRDLTYSDPTWVRQLAWEIDPASGNDENTGAPGLPLASFGELQRRWKNQELNGIYTVNVLSAVAGTDPVRFTEFTVAEGTEINVIGATTVSAGGTIDAVQAINRAANQLMQITSADVSGGWAANERRMVRINAGPRIGAFAFVVDDLGAGVAVVSPFATIATPGSSPALVTPVAGDTFEFVTPTPLGEHPTLDTGSGGLYTGRYTFNNFSWPAIASFVGMGFRCGSVRVNGCIANYVFGAGSANVICGNSLIGSAGAWDSSIIQLRAGCLHGQQGDGVLTAGEKNEVRLSSDVVLASGARVALGSTTGTPTCMHLSGVGLHLAGTSSVFSLLQNSVVTCGLADSVYGAAANNADGFRHRADSRVYHSGAGAASTVPAFTTSGTGVNVNFGGATTSTFAAIEAAGNVSQPNRAAWLLDV